MTECPSCGNKRTWKDGRRYNAGREIQRYLCRECGYRFSDPKVKGNIAGKIFEQSEPGKNFSKSDILQSDFSVKPPLDDLSFQGSENVRSHNPSTVTIAEKELNIFRDYNRHRRVCASEAKAVKNLVEVEVKPRKDGLAGATKLTEAEVQGKLVEFTWYMMKQGYAKSTIESRGKLLKRMVKLGIDLSNPETVKKIVAKQLWCAGRKSNACDTYTTFLKMLGKTWDRPIYKSIPKLPFIPQEAEIDQLIAACSPRMACFLQLLKETGMRPGEAWQMSWIEIDTVTRTVRVTPKKGSNPRIFHVSAKLAAMLETQPRNYGDRVFTTTTMRLDYHQNHFVQQRKRAATKLKNPRINQITFKTFRHWKGTMEYHRTKDIVYVQRVLGHRSIKNTLMYITLAEELFKGQQDYVSKIATNVKEACTLVDVGFEYVTGEYHDGGKIFRKPKYG